MAHKENRRKGPIEPPTHGRYDGGKVREELLGASDDSQISEGEHELYWSVFRLLNNIEFMTHFCLYPHYELWSKLKQYYGFIH